MTIVVDVLYIGQEVSTTIGVRPSVVAGSMTIESEARPIVDEASTVCFLAPMIVSNPATSVSVMATFVGPA